VNDTTGAEIHERYALAIAKWQDEHGTDEHDLTAEQYARWPIALCTLLGIRFNSIDRWHALYMAGVVEP
jgi:hypothetical protein